MGPTGSGKSSVCRFIVSSGSSIDQQQFIELASGINGIVGHSLESCTNEISVIKFPVPELLDSEICLVDTPGFDDTNKSDVDVFRMVSDWLNDT
jgi:predicted GTPase